MDVLRTPLSNSQILNLMENLDDHKLGATDQLIDLSSSEDNRAIALAMVTQGKKTLDIISRDMDPRIYNTIEFSNAVRDLACQAKYCKVRLLIHDSEPATKRGHYLVKLSRRLSSYIEIRKISNDFKNYNEAFMVVDFQGYIHRGLADRYEGSANFNDPGRARELTEYFDEVWRHSLSEPDLRQLYI